MGEYHELTGKPISNSRTVRDKKPRKSADEE